MIPIKFRLTFVLLYYFLMNKRQLVTLVSQEIVNLYQNDTSYKGRDYVFAINFDLFRIKAKALNMDLVWD